MDNSLWIIINKVFSSLLAALVEHAWVSIFRDNDTQTQHNDLFFLHDYVLDSDSAPVYAVSRRLAVAIDFEQLKRDLICVIMKSDVLHQQGHTCSQAKQAWAATSVLL